MMEGKIRIKNHIFPVNSVQMNLSKGSLWINFNTAENDQDYDDDLAWASPSLYCEEFALRPNGALVGEFNLCVFEHEPVKHHELKIKKNVIFGCGASIIDDKPVKFEIIEPILIRN